MYVLGFFIGIVMLLCTVNSLLEEKYTKAVVTLWLMVCCLGAIMYDVTSPIETVETEIVTNDYAKYGLSINSEKLGLVRYTENNATRWGARAKDRDEYSFLDFVE